MENFLIWAIGVAAVILFFLIVWLMFDRSRNGRSPSETVSVRRFLLSLLITGGTIIAGQNLITLVWPRPYDFVSVYLHISLIVVGVAALSIGAIFTLKDQAESKRKSQAAGDHADDLNRLNE